MTIAAPPTEIAEVLVEEFPWLELLPESALPEFVIDLVKAASMSVDTGQVSALAQTIREWKATADVYVDPALLDQLTGPLHPDGS